MEGRSLLQNHFLYKNHFSSIEKMYEYPLYKAMCQELQRHKDELEQSLPLRNLISSAVGKVNIMGCNEGSRQIGPEKNARAAKAGRILLH